MNMKIREKIKQPNGCYCSVIDVRFVDLKNNSKSYCCQTFRFNATNGACLWRDIRRCQPSIRNIPANEALSPPFQHP